MITLAGRIGSLKKTENRISALERELEILEALNASTEEIIQQLVADNRRLEAELADVALFLTDVHGTQLYEGQHLWEQLRQMIADYEGKIDALERQAERGERGESRGEDSDEPLAWCGGSPTTS